MHHESSNSSSPELGCDARRKKMVYVSLRFPLADLND